MAIVYGVLVTYEPERRETAEKYFLKFIQSLNSCYILIIVNNGKYTKLSDMEGTNINMEFSGWEEGIQGISFSDDDFFVFANDTFCTRQSWDILKRNRYRKKFIQAMINKNSACGEVNRSLGKFFIFNNTGDFWIRTDIYGFRGDVLKKLERLSLTQYELSRLVQLDESAENILWSNEVSLNLQDRIEKWIFPKPGQFGWYRSVSTTTKEKEKKVHSILNEKWLSLKLIKHNVTVFDCSSNKFMRSALIIFSRYRQIVLKK